MKKIFVVVMILVLMFTLCACGNMSMGVGNFSYEKVHIETYSYSGCLTINKWYDGSTGIEVKTNEVGSLFLSEGTYILVEDTCPICSHTSSK